MYGNAAGDQLNDWINVIDERPELSVCIAMLLRCSLSILILISRYNKFDFFDIYDISEDPILLPCTAFFLFPKCNVTKKTFVNAIWIQLP